MRKNAQHIFAVYKTYKSDCSDLVQSDSIDFSCLFPHSAFEGFELISEYVNIGLFMYITSYISKPQNF